MSGLLLHKVLNIFLHNPVYEHYGFKMWGRILEKYDPRGKDALFESVSALCALKQVPMEIIRDYTSRACRLFSSLQGITFHIMENLFVIINADCDRSGALADRFRSGNPDVTHNNVDRIETLLESIESHSHIVAGLPIPKPSTIRGSAPKPDVKTATPPDPPPKSDLPKPTAPLEGTRPSYPPSHPK